jgi:hypothetical protein
MSIYRSLPKAVFLALALGIAAAAQDATPPAEKPTAQTATVNADQPPMPASTPGSATHVMGFEGVKRNTKGKYTVVDKTFKFGLGSVDVSNITDIFTGSESRQTGGTALMVAKMAVPYGGGRVLSLFSREQVDNLTIDYVDANGGAHSAIFMLPKGQAENLKKELVSRGAKASVPVMETAKRDAKEKK